MLAFDAMPVNCGWVLSMIPLTAVGWLWVPGQAAARPSWSLARVKLFSSSLSAGFSSKSESQHSTTPTFAVPEGRNGSAPVIPFAHTLVAAVVTLTMFCVSCARTPAKDVVCTRLSRDRLATELAVTVAKTAGLYLATLSTLNPRACNVATKLALIGRTAAAARVRLADSIARTSRELTPGCTAARDTAAAVSAFSQNPSLTR